MCLEKPVIAVDTNLITVCLTFGSVKLLVVSCFQILALHKAPIPCELKQYLLAILISNEYSKSQSPFQVVLQWFSVISVQNHQLGNFREKIEVFGFSRTFIDSALTI